MIRIKEDFFLFSTKKYLLWIVVIAISVRILAMLFLQSWDFEIPGKFFHESGEIASSVAKGLGFSWPADTIFEAAKPNEPTSWEPPIYILIIAAAFKIFGTYTTSSAVMLLLFQIFNSALCCVLIFHIGKRVFNERVGLIAALMLALYLPEMHFAAQKVQATIFFEVLLLLFILQFLKLAEAPTFKKSLLTGIIFGIAVLTVPAVISLLPFALGWLFFRSRAHFQSRLIIVSFVFLSAAVTISPWVIRNYLVFDSFIFVKSNISRELFWGNYLNLKILKTEKQIRAELDESQRKKFYSNKFLESIQKNPKRLFLRTKKRFVRFWTVPPNAGGPRAKLKGYKKDLKDKVVGCFYLVVVSLGLTGLLITLLKGRDIQLLFLCILSLPIPYYLIWFTRFRYRYPIEPILIIFAGYAIYRFLILMNVTFRPKKTTG